MKGYASGKERFSSYGTAGMCQRFTFHKRCLAGFTNDELTFRILKLHFSCQMIMATTIPAVVMAESPRAETFRAVILQAAGIQSLRTRALPEALEMAESQAAASQEMTTQAAVSLKVNKLLLIS